LKIKLKGCHFDTTRAIEAESQAVLNTLTVFEQMAAPAPEIMEGSL
jgi:hypothetical protein